MGPTPAVVLFVPVLACGASALGLLVASRRSGPRVVVRLAALFLAFWAVLATTALGWVLTRGGGEALARLTFDPLAPFSPTAVDAWLFGAAGALVVFVLVFTVNQLVGRALLSVLRPRRMRWPSSLPRPAGPTEVMTFDSDHASAFSFALLEWGQSVGPRRREVVLLSRGFVERLTREEREAVIAHEVAHLLDLDGRYLTFVRTFARLMRWDPVVRYVARSLTRREEFQADVRAAALTGRPLALARALFKSMTLLPGRAPAGLFGLFGAEGGRDDRELLERIRRLVLLHETGAFAEESLGPL